MRRGGSQGPPLSGISTLASDQRGQVRNIDACHRLTSTRSALMLNRIIPEEPPARRARSIQCVRCALNRTICPVWRVTNVLADLRGLRGA